MLSISALDIANGLKELLINHGFTLDLLLKTPPAELAIILGIDLYVARLIYLTAKRSMSGNSGEVVADNKDMWSFLRICNDD